MPRYVLVRFEDNDKAKKFVEKVNRYWGFNPDNERDFSVRAVWAIPTKYCECTRSSNKMWSFSRGLKSGWWLHTDCGRPTRAWATGVHWFGMIGRNILPYNNDPVPQGWGLPNPATDPKTREVSDFYELDHEPSERQHRKSEKRRNRKRTINPRRV